MMRITNAMMTSNTKNNININKLNEDRLNTQISTGQVISRPSEDPVVAIRALRLNTNLSQLTQYYKKNIPDAQAWMNVTETALKQTDEIFTNIKENLTTGASDNHTATDRQKILESLKGLRAELYSSGNADYAERTVFTGYRTGESLTFLETDAETKGDKSVEYMIHETIDSDKPETIKYITHDDSDETKVQEKEVLRIRLSYDQLMGSKVGEKLTLTAGKDDTGDAKYKLEIPADPGKVVTKSIAGQSQAVIDGIYTNVGPGEVVFIPETGELLFGTTTANQYTKFFSDHSLEVPKSSASFEYSKNEWQSGDLRPEHYFACVRSEGGKDVKYNYGDERKNPVTGEMFFDPDIPNFQNQNLEVEISFNQKITINTHANEVYTHNIGRDIDELLSVTQSVVDAEDSLKKSEAEMAKYEEGSAQWKNAKKAYDAAEKEFSLKKDKMQKMFSAALDKFDAYADRNNVAIANIGSMQSRLTITKERVADQLQSFKELADKNINAELTETSIDFSSAKLALEAAQLAAGKIAQQTLLNYL